MKKLTLIIAIIFLLSSCHGYEGSINKGDVFVDVDSNPFRNDTVLVLEIRGEFIKYKYVSKHYRYNHVDTSHDFRFRKRFFSKSIR